MKLQKPKSVFPVSQSPVVILLRLIFNVCALLITSFLFEKMRFGSFMSVLLSAVLLGLVNTFIRPVLLILTLPITIFTLGAAIIPLNGLILFIVSRIVPGFYFDGFWTIMGAALVMGAFGFMINLFISSSKGKREKDEYLSMADDPVTYTEVEYEVKEDKENRDT
ncbi:MAG: phage holin family protein [Candidatus Theseobacter exili]|nr:phage holin family protein [Candidatus Theseobacter exili]